MVYKVCVVGAPGTGKSTIINSLFKKCVIKEKIKDQNIKIEEELSDDVGNKFQITYTHGLHCIPDWYNGFNKLVVNEAINSDLVLFVIDGNKKVINESELKEYKSIAANIYFCNSDTGKCIDLVILFSKYGKCLDEQDSEDMEYIESVKREYENDKVMFFNAHGRIKHFGGMSQELHSLVQDNDTNYNTTFDITEYCKDFDIRQENAFYEKFVELLYEEMWNNLELRLQNRFFKDIASNIVLNENTKYKPEHLINCAHFCIGYYNKKVHDCDNLGINIFKHYITSQYDIPSWYRILNTFDFDDKDIENIVEDIFNTVEKDMKLINVIKDFFVWCLINNEQIKKYLINNFNKYVTKWKDMLLSIAMDYTNEINYMDVIRDSEEKNVIVRSNYLYYSCKKCPDFLYTIISYCCDEFYDELFKFVYDNEDERVDVEVLDIDKLGEKYCANSYISPKSIHEKLDEDEKIVRQYLIDKGVIKNDTHKMTIDNYLKYEYNKIFTIFKDLESVYKDEIYYKHFRHNVECIINKKSRDNTVYKCGICGNTLNKSFKSLIKRDTPCTKYTKILNDQFVYYTSKKNNELKSEIFNIQYDEFLERLKELTSDDIYILYNKLQLIYNKDNIEFDFEKYILDDDHHFIELLKNDKDMYEQYIAIINNTLKRIGLHVTYKRLLLCRYS